MVASRELHWIDPRLIVIDEESRQRQMNKDIGDLIPSVRARGVLHPVLLDRDHNLKAGWRRTKTALFLELSEIPFRYLDELSEIEAQMIELEENLRRQDLMWQDKARAFHRIHALYLETNGEDWKVEQTAQMMGFDDKHVWRMIELGEAIAAGDEGVIKAETIANAYTILTRRRARATDEALQRILAVENDPAPVHVRHGGSGEVRAEDAVGDVDHPSGDLGGGGAPAEGADHLAHPARSVAPPYSILCADAHEFLAGFVGPKFNLLHADLPYGVELNEQANQAAFEGDGYDSNPDIYYALMDSILDNWDKFMLPSAHIVWWFAFGQNPESTFYEDTKERFKRKLKHLDLRINPNPLIWHKTDNRGILPDAMRTPRNIGEYALLMSTGDRKLVKPKSNIYGAPTQKAESIHTNEKPEPMLRHFLEMVVDQHSRVIDPTCGSGSAIRVSETLKAEAALGLERNAEFAERANNRLIRARGLNKLSETINRAADEAMQSVLDSTSKA